MTPVVVSSVPPMMFSISSRFSVWMMPTVSAPSSMVKFGLYSKRAQDVLVVGVVVLALDGEGGDAVVLDQRGGDIVLGGQGVGGAQHDVHAAGLQGPHEVRGLGRDVQAGDGGQPFERLLLLEALADGAEHGHLALGPLDAAATGISEAEVFHIVGGGRDGHRLQGRGRGGGHCHRVAFPGFRISRQSSTEFCGKRFHGKRLYYTPFSAGCPPPGVMFAKPAMTPVITAGRGEQEWGGGAVEGEGRTRRCAPTGGCPGCSRRGRARPLPSLSHGAEPPCLRRKATPRLRGQKK